MNYRDQRSFDDFQEVMEQERVDEERRYNALGHDRHQFDCDDDNDCDDDHENS